MQRYDLRGVSAAKEDVHNAIKNVDKGIFPHAFCKIIPDILGGDPEWCNIMHADGAGTKSSLAYAYWRETGDLSVWKGIAQDALIMNVDDLLCVGATDRMLVSSTIGRNKRLVPGEVIAAIINGTEELLETMRGYGVEIYGTGGETADVGDLVRTIIVDSTVTTRMRRDMVIDNANISDGDVIVGLASFGQATYESEYNGGMGSNGLTSARHDVFCKLVAERYPETFDAAIPDELVYSGTCKLLDAVAGTPLNAGKLVLSPTRTYALHRRRTDKNHAFCQRQTCGERQPLPHPAPFRSYTEREWHGLGGNVQGVQHGTPTGSVHIAPARPGGYRHCPRVQYRCTHHRTCRKCRSQPPHHQIALRSL